jgi:hypothetical protein
VKLLQWRPRTSRQGSLAIRFPALGDYAGPARYLPGDASRLTERQRRAIGRVIEVRFMGIASGAGFDGQCMYQEMPDHGTVGPALIPASDLDFVDDSHSARTPNSLE